MRILLCPPGRSERREGTRRTEPARRRGFEDETLLLRPFNFETLATHVYAEASRGTYEDGSVAALLIVLVGLIPVALLARASRLPFAEGARAAEKTPSSASV